MLLWGKCKHLHPHDCSLVINTMANSLLLTTVASYVSLQHYAVLVAAALLVLLLSWRLWRFTIAPLVWPDEPKTLLYLFPIIGTLCSCHICNPGYSWMRMQSHRAYLVLHEQCGGYSRCRKARWTCLDAQESCSWLCTSKCFRHEPYLLSLGGLRTLIISDIEMVVGVWKDIILTFDPFIVATMRVFGIPSRCSVGILQPWYETGRKQRPCSAHKIRSALATWIACEDGSKNSLRGTIKDLGMNQYDQLDSTMKR